MHFSLSLTDGTEAFSTFENEPVSLVMGDGSLTDGMELALYGLSAGDDAEPDAYTRPGLWYAGQ